MTARRPDVEGQSARERRAANRRRHLAAALAKAQTPADVARVQANRARAALQRLERRDPQAAAEGWAALADLLGRFAEKYETRQARR